MKYNAKYRNNENCVYIIHKSRNVSQNKSKSFISFKIYNSYRISQKMWVRVTDEKVATKKRSYSRSESSILHV